jgi:homoisocitrate dehydrogenase
MYRICLLPGDGIGQEIIPEARRVLENTGLPLLFINAEAGWDTFETQGTSVPQETLDTIVNTDATLAGAFESPKQKVEGFFSAIRYLRRTFDLFANLRPAKSRPVLGCTKGVDMLMVRENTEGLYVAQERRYGDVAIADAVVTRPASSRIARVALEQAERRRKGLVIIHKANVLPITTGLFLETALETALGYTDVRTSDLMVDAAAAKLVLDPGSFDVLVTTNLFGDILSDLMAGLVGGLGLAPSANLGPKHAIFEPVHGTAPDIAGRGIANPTGAILAAAMMLDHLGESDCARQIDQAVDRALKSGPVTADLGGSAKTSTFTDAVISALRS